MRHLTQRGITLIELMITVSVVALLMAAGVPAMADYVGNARLRNAGDVLLSQALLAQTESLKRNATVQLEIVDRSIVVRDMSTTPPAALHQHRLPDGVTLTGAKSLQFGSEGHPLPWGTEYAINIRRASGECDASHACAVLRVYGGGGMGLCSGAKGCK